MHLSFIQGDKNGSILIHLHDNCQLCQHHLLKMLSFFHSTVLAPLSKIKYPLIGCRIGIWVHFWIFSSIPLIYLSVTIQVPCNFYHNCSVVQLEVRHGDFPRGSFIVEKSFCYPRFLLLQMNLQISLSNSVKN